MRLFETVMLAAVMATAAGAQNDDYFPMGVSGDSGHRT
jgi:hypothetical protein